MSEFKGTPGPWFADPQSAVSGWVDIRTPGYSRNAVAAATPAEPGDAEARRDHETLANAHLIAAAPELLAAAECDAAMDLPTEQGWLVLERHGWNREDRFDLPASEFVRRLRAAAIAKATGGDA